MACTRPLISKSSSPFINPLMTVPRAPIIIGINVTFMIHCFFNSLARSRYLSFFFLSFNFTLWSFGTAKSALQSRHCGHSGLQSRDCNSASSIFFLLLLIIIRSSRLAEIRWSVCVSKSQRSLCVSLSSTDVGLWIYHLFVRSNFNFLHNS